ncbi:hypothetical protein HMPREF1548_00273 [Clostridium sp. KLE 1755]|nr:hypothetical protein HMPREF1548_00273 [Clostridium sp. KLE 1755]
MFIFSLIIESSPFLFDGGNPEKGRKNPAETSLGCGFCGT